MEAVMELMPVRQTERKIQPYREVVDVQAEVVNIQSEVVNLNITTGHSKQFIEANTKATTLQHLKNDCVVPVFSKDNELTISHVSFIESVFEATVNVFPHECINSPEISVSYVIKGRTGNFGDADPSFRSC